MNHLDNGDQQASGAFVLGLGCERGACADEVIALAEQALLLAGIDRRALICVATLDVRLSEPAILAAAAHFAVPLKGFPAAVLEDATPRLETPSDRVFALTGCHGVAEAAALVGAGEVGDLVVPKAKSAHATAAIAGCFSESNQELTALSSVIDSGALRFDSRGRPISPVAAEVLA
ncbi:MAG TPA: cobalamin biosynthesis protein [Pararhizobium sp.]|uniref:cobalamin biosynthesis protein n=1 Tax=Pararhizobium sp. TaxID=1977563 RepID=UPI002C6D6AF5|nr:cobalamin biosynthesis protein [Pararhizobium sp.]HTO33423.1 cobalamin biosynthesis protein [Pararhizobium sp.]